MKFFQLGILHLSPPPTHSRLLLFNSVFVLSTLMLLACNPSSSPDEESSVSEISIAELGVEGYDRLEFEMQSSDANFQVPTINLLRNQSTINVKVVPGTYKIRLDYFLGKQLVFGADLCPEDKKNNTKTFVAGPNPTSISICKAGSSTPIQPTKGLSFVINQGQLIDPSGKPFIMRGVNIPAAYYYDKSVESLPLIKRLGFNSVRIVWCADNLERADRCERKDFKPASKLEELLSKIRKQKLVAVLNLQNATGSDSREHLRNMVAYLSKEEIKSILIRYQDMLIINIANEWYGTWDKSRNFVDAYKGVIPLLRESLPHVFMVDLRGYAQDFSSYSEHGSELVNADPRKNVMLSAHMYDVFNSDAAVKNVFDTVRSKKLPFVVGEFACSHGSRGNVACGAIMKEAENSTLKVGTIAWSISGNSNNYLDLDILDPADWTSLSDFGETVINSPYGVAATSKEACFFSAISCPKLF